MSLSKEVTEAAQPRRPKCARCRHHGIIVPQRGHLKTCPFVKCDCWKCYLVTERTRITALHRNLRKAQGRGPRGEERSPRHPAGEPAAEGRAGASVPGGGAGPPGASGPACPPSAGPPGGCGAAAAGGEQAAGVESEVDPPCSPFNAPDFNQRGQTPPPPVIHFPVRGSGHYPGSYAPCPNFLFNVPWLPPVPVGFYSDALWGPQIFPYFLQGAVHYPAPAVPEPPADHRQVFLTLQPPPFPAEAFQEEVMPRRHLQPPPPKHAELEDIEELD